MARHKAPLNNEPMTSLNFIELQASVHNDQNDSKANHISGIDKSILFQFFPPAFVLVKVVHAAAAVVVAVFAMATVHVLVDGVISRVVPM